jgi:hypothetical protein
MHIHGRFFTRFHIQVPQRPSWSTFCRHPVSPRIRMGDHQKLYVPVRPVHHLMDHTGSNLQPFLAGELNESTIHLNRQISPEHEEKLSRHPVKMADFRCPGRHPLMDHAQFVLSQQDPSVASISPGVVLCVVFACFQGSPVPSSDVSALTCQAENGRIRSSPRGAVTSKSRPSILHPNTGLPF